MLTFTNEQLTLIFRKNPILFWQELFKPFLVNIENTKSMIEN